VSEANAAIAMARSLGMAYGDFSGSIVYYDMENYNENDYACRTAVNWFLTGWAAQLQYLRSKAGAYGGAYDISASWASLTPPVDAVWIAHWTRTYYSAGESVWDSIVPDQLWNNHQRAKQYAGGHFETWGSNTLNIDSDVIDGPVASVVVPNAVSVIGVSVYDITGTLKTDVFPNEQLGLSAAINNTDPLPNPVSLQISVSGECGPFINYATVYTAPSGLSAWGEYKAAPALLCNGSATYQVIANFGGYVTTKSAPLTLHGITRRFILPLIRRY
jgi:hypothetical protein